jgi:allantoicase
MGEGWETARRRDADNDWVMVRLGLPGLIRLVELDMTHFKGNAPGEVRLTGVDAGEGSVDDSGGWFDIVPRTRVQPDTRHRLRVTGALRATHVRLDAYPDGGMARLRLFGEPAPGALDDLARRWFDALPAAHQAQVRAQSDWPQSLPRPQ